MFHWPISNKILGVKAATQVEPSSITEILIEALEFYADRRNWDEAGREDNPNKIFNHDGKGYITPENGARAREVLRQIGYDDRQ